jgi:hypothetical protein
LNLATYQMSQRMELTTFLQSLCYEASSAITISASSGVLTFDRVDPTLNVLHDETSSRLPWPIPADATSSGLLNPAYLQTVEYRFESTEKNVTREAFGTSAVVAVNIGEFSPTLESGGTVLSVDVRPAEMTAPVKGRILLPVVQP